MESVSVIIPVYNSRCFLKECVASLAKVNSNCGSVIISEMILVDDGSTDGSSELCDSIAETNASNSCVIRVIHQRNRGVSAARNEGLRAASGSFIFFVDSDDTVDPRKLAELIQRLDKEEHIDMAVFGMEFDYYSGDKIYRKDIKLPCAEGVKSFDECSEMLYNLFKCNAVSSLCNKLIRRSVIEDAGIGLREDMFLYEDLEFSLRAMARCKRFCFCREPIYRYRQAADEGNAGRRLKRIQSIPELVDKIEDVLVPFGGSDDILLSLYLVLAREKIGCATKTETDIVCSDFREWIDGHGLRDKLRDNEYGMLLYDKHSTKLLLRRRILSVRHRVAVVVKKTIGDFRR